MCAVVLLLKMDRKQNSHTLSSRIVQDAFSAVSGLDDHCAYYLSGGMGVQTYLPRRRHRPTRDVDLTLDGAVDGPRFRSIFTPLAHALQDQGYTTTLGKRRHGYFLHLEDEHHALDLQVRRQNAQHVMKYATTNARELAHAHAYRPTWLASPVAILAPEDLLLRKLLRITTFEQEYGLLPRPWSYRLSQQLANVKGFRTPLLNAIAGSTGEPSDVFTRATAIIRLQADLYDVEALIRLVQFDKTYFTQGLEEYQTLRARKEKVLSLLDALSCERSGAGFEDAFPTEIEEQ